MVEGPRIYEFHCRQLLVVNAAHMTKVSNLESNNRFIGASHRNSAEAAMWRLYSTLTPLTTTLLSLFRQPNYTQRSRNAKRVLVEYVEWTAITNA